MDFRTDINGLRAIAVVSVVLYHFGVLGFAGGYVGVDVFFVISGYLMMHAVASKLAAGRFSLLDFYAARARRIIPALFAMLCVLLAAGFFASLPLAYMEMARGAAAAIAFVSNVVFWRERGYFDTPSQEKWLLHTWSLSVEWQFYLLFPLLVLALYRLASGKAMRAGLALVFGASLALCVAATPWKPTAAFFLLPTRAWELLAGALVYALGERRPRGWLAAAGIALIALATAFYDETMLYPGFLAIAPVLGAALVIFARSELPLLTNPVAQWLGTVSYSLYLWHWPLVAAARRYQIALSPAVVALLCAASLALAYASYRLVEVRSKERGRRTASRAYLGRAGAACAGLVAVALAIVAARGLPFRVPELAAQNDALAADWQFPGACQAEGSFCRFGPDGGERVLFWGDSHIEQLYPALAALVDAGETGGRQILMGTRDGCIPIRGMDNVAARDNCPEWNDEMFQRAQQPDVRSVVIGSIWMPRFRSVLYDETTLPTICKAEADECRAFADSQTALAAVGQQLRADAKQLIARGKRVVLIRPVPIFDRNVSHHLAECARSGAPIELALTRAKHEQLTAGVQRLLAEVAADTGATLIDPADTLCPNGTCLFAQDGLSIYTDNNHLASVASRMLVPALRPVFR